MGKYDSMNVAALKAEHKRLGLTGYSKLRKPELIAGLEARDKAEAPEPEPIKVEAPKPEPVERKRYTKYPSTKIRNKAKARRRALRAAGFQAGY